MPNYSRPQNHYNPKDKKILYTDISTWNELNLAMGDAFTTAHLSTALIPGMSDDEELGLGWATICIPA